MLNIIQQTKKPIKFSIPAIQVHNQKYIQRHRSFIDGILRSYY